MNVNYYLKNEKKERTSVEAVVRHKGKRFKISTGQSVVVNYWDKTTHRARITRDYPDHELINLKLEEFEIAIKKTFTEAIRQSTEPSIEQLRAATGTSKAFAIFSNLVKVISFSPASYAEIIRFETPLFSDNSSKVILFSFRNSLIFRSISM